MEDSLKFSKEDVRKHLAELGYSNIEGNHLDEFCEDLKRLIQYEEKKQNIGRKLDQLDQMERTLAANKENEDLTFASKKKRRIRKEDKRRLKEEKLKSKEFSRSTSSYDAGIEDETRTSDKCDSSSLYIDVNLPPSRPHSAKSPPLAASLVEQPPPGFIRVRSGPSVGKRPSSSDPVALHQKYQGYWDKFGVPGEKRHDKLRWAVRGWMMGEEPL